MHILINGWFLNQLTTGCGQYLHQLMAQFAQGTSAVETSVRFTVLYPATAQNADQRDRWPGMIMQPMQAPPLPLHLRKLWWEQITMPRAAQRFQADLLWIPYWAAPLWQPCPTVVTVHDIIHHLLPAYRGGRLQRLYTSLVSYTAQRSAAVITVSHAAKRDIVTHLRLPDDRVHVVYNGANQNAIEPDDKLTHDRLTHGRLTHHRLTKVREKYGLPARFFLYLGGFDVRKNVATTLHAYRRYLDRQGDPAVRLVIAGALPAQDSPFTPDPKKIAAELNLTDQVQFCGWIDEADKPAFYALSIAYLFPSLYEGFGLMVIEAMQAGAPVVTSAE